MKHLPPPLDSLLADVPGYVVTAMGTALASVVAMVGGVIHSILAQFPDPAQAAQWSERGYLIVAIIVLFTSLVTVVSWIATKGLKAFQDLAAALNRLTDTVDKQNDYFDEVAKNAVRSALTTPPRQ